MEIFLTIIIMTLVVSLSGVAAKAFPIRIPLPLLQIAVGALLAWPSFGLHVDFDPGLFLVLFIPPLLFADGWKTPTKEFLQHSREIIGLALILVVITVVVIGYLIYWIIPGVPLISAFALAAVLSPTDAIALAGIVGEKRIPKRISTILQAEALMNDASGLVSLKFAVAVAMGTMVFTISGATVEFLKVALGGLLAGIAVCWLYGKSLRLFSRWNDDDPATQTLLLLLLPFSSYLVAEHLGFSGILASVSAGLTITHSGIIRNAPLAMRLRANSVWKMLEFVFNGMVFLMLGLQLPSILETSITSANSDPDVELWMLFTDIALLYFALLALRFLWLLAMKQISQRFFKKNPLEFGKYSTGDVLIASFAGVRGAITLAGVLSIPLFLPNGSAFPGRYELVFLATGVILFSLLVGVITLPVLLRGVEEFDEKAHKREMRRVRAILAGVAIEHLHKMEEKFAHDADNNMDLPAIKEINKKVIDNLRHLTDEGDNLEKNLFLENMERHLRLSALNAERTELYRLHAKQKISEEILKKLLERLDLTEAFLTGKGS